MAAQAALIAETIAGMKQALARYEGSSDSDEPYLHPSNRGTKLKRKVHSIQDGHSGRSSGPKVYKRNVDHAGYRRDILRRNPKRYDEDGDELFDSDVDEDADARAAEENPYAEIHLENLLMPLTSSARLPKHPSLSIAYTSPILTDMAQHACEMVQRERKTLASAKRLMTKLRGDQNWIPCELLCSRKDEAIFGTEKLYNDLAFKRTDPRSNGTATRSMANSTTNDASFPGSPKSSQSGTELGSASETITGTHEVSAMEVISRVEDANTNDDARPRETLEIRPEETGGREAFETSEMEMVDGSITGGIPSDRMPEAPGAMIIALGREAKDTVHPAISVTGELRPEIYTQPDIGESLVKGANVNGTTTSYPTQDDSITGNGLEAVLAAGGEPINHPGIPNAENPREEQSMDGIEEEDTIKSEPRRMRTRAQAQAASELTLSSRTESPDSILPQIHPLFKIPELAIPDKDFGLPPNEADETRRLLTMYVQKQEEVCRGAEKLYDGLLQADRQRSTVYKWCKAEGHVGEMSDGEDWYDKEEWGLEEDLEKGHNDEEGENNAIQGRKPRRRA